MRRREILVAGFPGNAGAEALAQEKQLSRHQIWVFLNPLNVLSVVTTTL
ncbi:hypothetical protein HPT29_009675 [Microvirga terrae]|uniref:Uncharacterized protein n=1 Tax=Microvirga terrae TaxID=2740529 RepID=A0ABY5S020_9HYPH|nr:hypothetical protein [Microvirga terrae]UVF21367.1 hypothetical protein HPT29_009675 [Microvirga terrae]